MAVALASIAAPTAGKCAASMAAKNYEENIYSSISNNIWDRKDFPHEVRFSAGIGPALFPAETTRPLGPRLSAIFTILSIFLYRSVFLINIINGH